MCFCRREIRELKDEKQYWSSTASDGTNRAAVFNFRSGEISELEMRTGNAFMLCVRSNVCSDSGCVSACANNPCSNMANSDKICTPEDEERYSCGCIEDYYWNGEECVNPCKPNPCYYVDNSSRKYR